MNYNEQIILQQSSRLSAITTRAAHEGITASRRRIARESLTRALTAAIRDEDQNGAENAAWITDQLTTTRQYAMDVGVLTAEDVCRIESEVIE